MKGPSTTTNRSESGLLDELASQWGIVRGTGWRVWLQYLAPRDENEDPRFRESLTRLSVIGLRSIAGVCVGGALLWIVLGPLFVPESLSTFGAAALGSFSLVGIVIFVLSFWAPAQSRARVLGLSVLAVLPVLDLLGSVRVPITSGERWAFLVASMILMMLVAIAALPVRPLQMTAFGVVFIGIYASAVLASGSTLSDGSAASIAFVFLMMTSLTCTGLTVVMYQQRVAAYRARRAAQQALEELRETQVRVNVSENAASQSRFAAALSHELNTPLGSLTSAFDTVTHAHERELAHPDTRERLESVWADATRSGRQATLRLRTTIERMKRLTNLDRAEEQVVDLNELWLDTVALLSGEIEHKADVDLALNPLPPVRCRPQQVGAVFSNLLRNAAAAMDEKGQIVVSSEHRGEDIVLEVRDNGRGMPNKQVKDLFSPTFHIDGARVATTNWGLFVCRSIITEHGGMIEIESEQSVGTTVRIVLPAPAHGGALEHR